MTSVHPTSSSPGATPSTPPPKKQTPKKQTPWEWIVNFFENLFHPQRHFTEAMKRQIVLAKMGPHDPEGTSIEEEDQKLEEALLKFIGKTLKNAKQEKEIGRFYELLYKMVGTVTSKQGEVERLRREYLPTILTELLLSEEGKAGEIGDLFAALCPFFTNGRLELDPHRTEDQPIIQAYQSVLDRLNFFSSEAPTVSIQELSVFFPDKAQLSSYLVAKFKAQMEKDPARVDAFLETMGSTESPKMTIEEQKSNLERIATHLVPMVVDAFLAKIRGKGDLSPLFDKGIEILKDHLASLADTNQEQEELRQTIDELRGVLLTNGVLDIDSASLVRNIWGDDAGLLNQKPEESIPQMLERRKKILDGPVAKKREEYYLKEARYQAMKIDGESVGDAALNVTDNLNQIRKEIRHEIRRPEYREEDLKALLALRLILTSPTPSALSPEAEAAAAKIWGTKILAYKDVSDEVAHQNRVAFLNSPEAHALEKKFLEEPSVHFIKQKTVAVTGSPSKRVRTNTSSSSPMRPSSPTPRPGSPPLSLPVAAWGWEVRPNEFKPLTDERKKELDEICKTHWGISFQSPVDPVTQLPVLDPVTKLPVLGLLDLPSIDREYIFRELAYKNYVKDKMAGKIATLASTEINEMLSDSFLDELINTLKTSGELGPLEGLLNDKNFVSSIKKLLPAIVTNGTKWVMKNVVADMLLEAPQLKRLVDDVLPVSIETVHTTLIKTLLQQRVSDLAGAMIDPDKKRSLSNEIRRQYEGIVQKELLEKPPFEVDKVLETIFQTMEKDLAPVINEVKGNTSLSEKEKQNTMLEAMKFYLKGMPGDKNPVYTDLISVAAFDMGELPAPLKATWGSWPVQKALNRFLNLNEIITSSIYPYRKSPEELKRILTKKFEEMATKDAPTTVPFEIRLPYKTRPALPERIQERKALLTTLEANKNIGSSGTILSVNQAHPELVIRFEANKKWLEENDSKTVQETLSLLGLAPFMDQLLPESLQMPLREKMISDKMQKLVRPILTIAKVNLGVGVATSFMGKIKAAISEHIITQYVTESKVLKLIGTVMKKTLFRGLLYPQDTIAPLPTTAKALSPRSFKLIQSKTLPETRTLMFSNDEALSAQQIREQNLLADPQPLLEVPVVKSFASVLSDGLMAIIPAFLNAKAWLFQSALLLTGQASRTETEAIVKRLLQTADFTPPVQGGWESNASYVKRYGAFAEKVLATFNGLKVFVTVVEIRQLMQGLIAQQGDQLTPDEKQSMSGIVDFLIQYEEQFPDEDLLLTKESLQPFFALSPLQQKNFYTAVQTHAVNKILASKTVTTTQEKVGRTLATNLVLRSGAESEMKVAPLQGASWTEKLLYPLLDVLETERGFLEARAKMRQLGEQRGLPHAKAFQLAALMASEKRVVDDQILFDPISAYLREHQDRLAPLLRPPLLSLAPKEHQAYRLDQLIPDQPDEVDIDYLAKITSSQRWMGLLMRDIERAESPFYSLLDELEERDDFKVLRGEKNISAFKNYFESHLEDASFSKHLRPVLISFQKPEDELVDFDLSTRQLYQKYKEHLFNPLPLFKTNFKGLMRDEGNLTKLLNPILVKFHAPYSVGNLTTEQLYEQHLPQLTEGAFESRVRNDELFGKLVSELILHFLTHTERLEVAKLSDLQLFEKYKGKLFESNLFVSLMTGDAVRKAPPLFDKLAEILIPPLVGEVFLKLQELDKKEVVVDGVKKQKRIFKSMADRAAERAHLHFEGVLSVESKKNPKGALDTFKHTKGAHPVIEKRNVERVDDNYKEEVKKFSLQLVKQLRSTFLTDPVKDKLIRLLWDRKDEIVPLIGLDAEILQGFLTDEEKFASFGLSMLESFLVPGRLIIADVITDQILDKGKPEKFQRILLNAIPAITNVLKPIILNILFLIEAKRNDQIAEILWNYTQNGTGDLGPVLAEFARRIDGVKFTPEQILEVEKSLFEKYSALPIAPSLSDFKALLSMTEVKKVNFAEHLINNGFKGGMFSKDRLKVGIKSPTEIAAFDKVAESQRAALEQKGIFIEEAEFVAAKESVLKALQSDTAKGLSSRQAKNHLLTQLGLKKSDAYGPLIHQFASKVINTVVPTTVAQGSVTAAIRYGATETINDFIVDILKPIIESDNPVTTLSTLLQPAITDVLNRDTFTKKEVEAVPTEADFNASSQELARLIDVSLSEQGILHDWVKSLIQTFTRTTVSDNIAQTMGKTLFDLTKHAPENENLLFHLISAISEQLEPPES